MIEGQEGVTWEHWVALASACEEHGVEALFRSDHYISGSDEQRPALDAWTTIAGLAARTTKLQLGTLVSPATFRHPSALARAAATADEISAGRVTLGIGAGWMEREHEAYGFEFGDGFPERLRWLGEALPIMRGMLRGERPTASGPRYRARAARNAPPPLQERLPLLVGGGGEQVTLKLVAKYADANNVGGGIAKVRQKEAVLLRHCETVGRDPAEIERTASLGVLVILMAVKSRRGILGLGDQARDVGRRVIVTPESQRRQSSRPFDPYYSGVPYKPARHLRWRAGRASRCSSRRSTCPTERPG